MNSRERLLALLKGEITDCVPVCPDISNMVPARLTGKPFWDIYIYQDPPLWKAHIDAIKYFDIDGEAIANCDGHYDNYYQHRDIYEWKKLPSKKWCIEQIKMHLFWFGNSSRDSPSTSPPRSFP